MLARETQTGAFAIANVLLVRRAGDGETDRDRGGRVDGPSVGRNAWRRRTVDESDSARKLEQRSCQRNARRRSRPTWYNSRLKNVPEAALPKLVPLVIVASLFAGLTEPALAQNKPPASRLVEIGMPHVAKRGNGYVLVQTVATTSGSAKDKFWALVEINNPDGSRHCEWLKAMEAKQAYRFECPLQDAVGQKLGGRVRIYTDAKLEDRELFYEPAMTITQQLLNAAEAAPAGVTPVPDGVLDAMETPLPAIFKPTWYRRVDKGFSLRAYENSGDLTVSADELAFVDGKMSLKIPYAKIHSIRWEPLPNDIANHWVVVRFTNAEGHDDGVAFRDGGRMGNRGSTGPIYQAARTASKK